MPRSYESALDVMMLYRSLVERDVFTVRGGLTKQQLIALIGVAMCEPVSSGGLANYLSLPPQNVSRNAVELETKGYVTREVDPENRRQIILTLSEKGRQFISAHRKKVRDKLEESLSTLGEDERDLLVDASRVTANLLRKTLEKPARPNL
ncbi:MAG: MarR family transcriptional regulator [Eggerthellaceae bacterium]|nr:MarR family transcriptional regulator [Eggerthellaceae bacterium]